jgi:hypothetical protein
MTTAVRRSVPLVLLACALATSFFVATPRALADEKPVALTIVDEQGTSHVLSIEDLGKLPRKAVKVPDAAMGSIEYQGVSLPDLLSHCGVALGKELRGPRLASYVLIEATDGYRVVVAIAEVDPATTDKVMLLADHRDGAVLGEREAPFRLVIPDEKRPVRWIRMIKRISVQRADG